jgi:hypothetical protein
MMNIKETGSTRGYNSKKVQLNITKTQQRKDMKRWNISKNKHILNHKNVAKAGQDAKEGLDRLLKKFNMNEEIKRIQKKRFQSRVSAARMRLQRRKGGRGVEGEEEEESENTSVSSYNSDDDSDSEEEEEEGEENEKEGEKDEEDEGVGRGRREGSGRGSEITNEYKMKLRNSKKHDNNNMSDYDFDHDDSNKNIKIKKEVEDEEEDEEEEEEEEDREGRENEKFDEDEYDNESNHNRTNNTENDNQNEDENENEETVRGRRRRNEDDGIGWEHIGQKTGNVESKIPFNLALKLEKIIEKDRLYDMKHTHTYSQKMKNNRKLRRVALINFGKMMEKKKWMDDNKGMKYEESVRNRYKVYADNMLPLLNELGRSGVLEIDDDDDDDNDENNASRNRNENENENEYRNRCESRKEGIKGTQGEEEEEDEDTGFLKLMEQDLRKRMIRGRGDEVENHEDGASVRSSLKVKMMERKGMRVGGGGEEMNGRDTEMDELKDGEKEECEQRKRDEEEGERGEGEIEERSHRGPRREKYTMENISYGAFDHQYGRPVKSYAHRNRYVQAH